MTQSITLHHGRPLAEQADKGHNRWHPDIPPVLEVEPGEAVEMDTLDAADTMIRPDSTLAEVEGLSPNAHPLTGPVYIKGAEPGDLLAVHIVEILPQPFGWTRNRPGFGFLRDLFTESHLTRWSIREGFATSEDLQGVRIPGAPFMGVMGLAPSHELHRQILARETELAQRGGMVLPPKPEGAVPESLGADGLRTIPPRENGGNVDIRHLVAGTTVYMPVFQEGALFSTGDAHFAQGDGEVCGTAVEMGATFRGRFEIVKGAAGGRRDMSFEWLGAGPPPHLSLPARYYATTGLSIHKDGRNESEDLNLAARNALLNMIDYLRTTYGYSDKQAYHLCSVAVNLKISQVVDLPNVLVSAILPLDIFED